jgi:hypothetical protein
MIGVAALAWYQQRELTNDCIARGGDTVLRSVCYKTTRIDD